MVPAPGKRYNRRLWTVEKVKAFAQSFGKQMREIRLRREMSQIQLGLLVGTGGDRIYAMERGRGAQSAWLMCMFADALDLVIVIHDGQVQVHEADVAYMQEARDIIPGQERK
jgi:DNA-binding XRE family transcriptional regulator